MALEQITDDGFPGFKSVDFIGQMIVGVEPLGRYWFWSALADALSYNTLDRSQAETSPDRIVGLIASHNEVLVFGERTIEPWALAPTDTATFQLQTGSVIESGCASGDTIKRLDNSVFYLTNSGQIARLNGYTPLVISTAAIESAIRDLKWSRAFAFTYEENGHAIYYITFPDGQTFGYDVRQNAWHRRESYGMSRWRVNCMEKSNGTWYAGDYSNGRIYQLDYGSVYEGCEIMPRRIRTGVLHHDTNRVKIDGFRVLSHAGTPSEIPSYSTPGRPEDEIIVTGSEVGTGDPVFCSADAIDVPVFTGIPTSTGASLDGASPAYYGGRWLAVGQGGTRYATALAGPWTTGTLSFTTYGADLVAGGPDGWLTQSTVRIGGEGYAKAPLVPVGFGAYSITRMLTSPYSPDTVNWLSMIRYTGGYWWADQDGTLMRSPTLSNTNWEVIGNYRPDYITWFRDVAVLDDEIYVACAVNIDGPTQRYQIRKWNGASFDVLLDNAYGELQPWQLAVGNGVIVAYCWGGTHVYTSADNFATAHSTGIESYKAVTIQEEAKGRQIEFTAGYFYLISGDGPDAGKSNKCVVTANGITFGSPISLPITAAIGMAVSDKSVSYDGTWEALDNCVAQEGGFFQIRYSNDGGENWSNWRDFEAPKAGNFLQPMVTRRLGMATHRIWELMDTSNRPQDVLAASIIVE